MSTTDPTNSDRLQDLLTAAETGATVDESGRAFVAELARESRPPDDHLDADLGYLKAHFAYVDGDAESALQLYLAAADTAERAGHTARRIACLRGIAICHEYAGHQVESVGAVFQALDLAEDLGEPRILVRALSALLVLYESQGAHGPALETSMRIHTLAEETDDAWLLATAACYCGLFCGYLGQADEGLSWIEKGFEISNANDGFEQLTTYLRLYEFFLLHEAGRIREALMAAEAQLDVIRTLPAQNAAATYVDVAEIYLSAGLLSRSAEMLELADKAAHSDQLNAHLLRYYKVAADLHEARGETAVALRFLRSYTTLHEKIRGQQARVRLVTVERRFAAELAEKNREINELRTVELVEKNAQLAELNHQKDEILNVVAHDLRSPLAAAQMLSESLLLDAERNLGRDNREQLTAIRAATSEMVSTIDTLLQIQSGSSPSVLDSVDAVVRRSVSWVDDPAAERDIAVTLDIHPIDLRVDGALLRRSLDDVLRSRLHAIGEGGSIAVTAKPTHEGATILIETRPASDLGDEQSLYFARRLIERMSGSIEVSAGRDGLGTSTLTTIHLRRP